MTFLEAAIEILRNESEALHFAEIARRAVEQNLLSHVGRDPEAAMRNCLTNEVRGGSELLTKPRAGYYRIREGAVLPEPPKRPEKPASATKKSTKKKTTKKAAKKKTAKSTSKSKTTSRSASKTASKTTSKKKSTKKKTVKKTTRKKTAKKVAATAEETVDEELVASGEPVDNVETETTGAEEAASESSEETAAAAASEDGDAPPAEKPSPARASEAPEPSSSSSGRRKRRRRGASSTSRFGVRGEAPAPQSVAVKPSRRGSDASKRQEVLQKVTAIEFEAPQGSGMEGVTDVALVMANAMSRLAEERPELRSELEQMQQQQMHQSPPASAPTVETRSSRSRGESNSSNNNSNSNSNNSSSNNDERGGRRRRRRRRRGRRVDWAESQASEGRPGQSVTDQLLEKVAKVLEDAGSRSLHIRQISETLANQGVLGGEISEIERAVTASLLIDTHKHGRMSRFVARGDARYQLQGGRLPQPVAAAERELRSAMQALEAETRLQVTQWLQSLGLRGLEALVRIYLEREGYTLQSSLPAGRGMGKLVVYDPDSDEDDPRALVLIAPRKTAIEPGCWQQDLDRNPCGSVMVFYMTEDTSESWGDARVIRAAEFARWLQSRGIGVARTSFSVAVLDPTVIESISGLDT